MASKPKQIDLEEAIAKTPKAPQKELHDAFTGELFQPKARNHYEEPDPVPFAPALQIERPSVRQRIENLISRGVDPLQDYVRREALADELQFDIPDDPEAPLTHAEQAHLDMVASQIAEQAPLPDDGLPRPPQPKAEASPEDEDTPGGGGSSSDSAPPKGATGGDPPPVQAPSKGKGKG